MTYMQAALTVLAYAERPLTIPEITAVAVAQGLVRPRGKTPDRTMSSVLYRRMAADPDAPIVAKVGRFWLRDRPLPETEAAYLAQRARRARASARRLVGQGQSARVRRAAPSALPLPPLRLPDEVVQGALAQSRDAAFAP